MNFFNKIIYEFKLWRMRGIVRKIDNFRDDLWMVSSDRERQNTIQMLLVAYHIDTDINIQRIKWKPGNEVKCFTRTENDSKLWFYPKAPQTYMTPVDNWNWMGSPKSSLPKKFFVPGRPDLNPPEEKIENNEEKEIQQIVNRFELIDFGEK